MTSRTLLITTIVGILGLTIYLGANRQAKLPKQRMRTEEEWWD